MCREVGAREEGGDEQIDEALAELRTKRGVLAETLSKLEVETREILLELLAEFDRRYSDIAEIDRGHYTTYFATVSPLTTVMTCMLTLQISKPAILDNKRLQHLPGSFSAG